MTPVKISKYTKLGPFDLSISSDEWPAYPALLAAAIKDLRSLPNLDLSGGVYFISDYAGEHESAGFNTYTFLCIAGETAEDFGRAIQNVRKLHGLGSTEIKFQKTKHGPTSRALPNFLQIADQSLHGILITIAIDRALYSVFGSDKAKAKANLLSVANKINAGEWDHKRLERMYRIFIPLSLLIDVICHDGQKVLWMSDNDKFTEDNLNSSFQHAQEHFTRFFKNFSARKLELIGFAKPFEEHSYFTELLSLADLASGMTQEFLHYHFKKPNAVIKEERLPIAKWLTQDSPILMKKSIVLSKTPEGGVISTSIDFKYKLPD